MKIFYQTFGTGKKEIFKLPQQIFQEEEDPDRYLRSPQCRKDDAGEPHRPGLDWGCRRPGKRDPHETRRARKKEDIIISGANGNTITIDIVDTPGVTTRIDYHEFLEFGMEKEESITRAREATEGVAEAMHWLREDIDGVVYMLDSTLDPFLQVNIMMIGIIEARNLPVIIVANKIDLPDAAPGRNPQRLPPAPGRRDLGPQGAERGNPVRDHARILRVSGMPHKCTKCGREYKDGSTEILKGCASCGGKKFLYIKEAEINRDVLEEKSIDEIAEETHEEVLEVVEPKAKKEVEMYDRVETIRIVSPGSYEINLEKMAQTDERIVSVGKRGVISSI